MLIAKKIIIGVCGGIASYKAVELVSRLQQAGALVDVILTERAEEFVSPLTFSALSHRKVYMNLWESSGEAAELHISLAQQADLLAIVPATANTIARLAHGHADNMVTTVALATRAPLILAPAMYHAMYTHQATQSNLEILKKRGALVIEPEVGRLASGDIGPGRLPETSTLLGAIEMTLGQSGDLAGRHVVITAGGTQEPIDPVRYLGNRSSGKMGYALATEARNRGARVTLISGPVALDPPYGIDVWSVETAIQMRDAVQRAIVDADVLVMSAAVADFRPAEPARYKIKKGSANTQGNDQVESLTLHLVKNPDILAEIGELTEHPTGFDDVHSHSLERPRKRLILIGFAAETHDLEQYARSKVTSKGLDLLVANDVSRTDSGFGTDTNRVSLFYADGRTEHLPTLPKADVAVAIWDRIIPL